MASVRGIAGIALLAVLVAGCDSTEPLQVGEQTFEVAFSAGGATVPVYLVYDAFEDNDGDFDADDVNNDGQPDFFLWCLTPSPQQTVNATSVPIGFTVQVTVLREGETTREMITSVAARDDSALSLAEYDTSPQQFGAIPTQSAITEDDNGTPRTFRFTNGRRLASANRMLVQATATRASAWGASNGNPLHNLNTSAYPLGNGLCSINDPGDAVIGRDTATSYPLQLTLNRGDTVTVQARRAASVPMGIQVLNPPAPSLSAALLRNGRPVEVRGSTGASAGPGNGFIFTFTSR